MKVVILSTATAYTGGAIITLMNVLPLLQKNGVEPYFILKGHGQLESVLTEKGIPYSVIRSYDWCVPEQKTKGLKNFIMWRVKSIINLIAELKTYLLFKNQRAEVYHINCIYNGVGVNAAKMLKIPVVWHLREFVDLYGETTVFFNTKRAWERINRANKIICVSHYLAQAYEDKIQDKTKLQVVYDGIDMVLFEMRKNMRTRNENIIIGLAGTAPIKNHRDAILAIKKVYQTGNSVVLKIVGRWGMGSYERSYKEELKNLIIENELEDCVEFIGMRNDMNEFWAECDISVVCSKRESFGLAATEAMACGVPLICSDTSISGELTENGKNVLVYRTGDSEELAGCIQKYIDQFGTRELEDKTERAAAYVRKHFSVEISAKKLGLIYKEVV